MRVVGIDPGQTGALAFAIYNVEGSSAELEMCDVSDMPITEINGKKLPCAYAIANLLREVSPDLIILESVQPMRGNGISSSWNFAQGFGATLAACQLSGDVGRVHLVSPQTWKRALGLTENKDDSLNAAREIFEDMGDMLTRKKDDGRAEALLLTEYWRQHLLPAAEIEVV